MAWYGMVGSVAEGESRPKPSVFLLLLLGRKEGRKKEETRLARSLPHCSTREVIENSVHRE